MPSAFSRYVGIPCALAPMSSATENTLSQEVSGGDIRWKHIEDPRHATSPGGESTERKNSMMGVKSSHSCQMASG